jgi:hypothetical protein
MNDAGTLPQHMLDISELTAETFAPYGQIIAPLRTGGQGAETRYDPETSPGEAKLVLGDYRSALVQLVYHLIECGLRFLTVAAEQRSHFGRWRPCCCIDRGRSEIGPTAFLRLTILPQHLQHRRE